MFTYIVLMFGVTQDPCFQHEVSLKKRSNNVFIKSDFIHKSISWNDVKTEMLYFSPCAILSEATSSSWEDIPHRYPGGSCHEDCHLLCALLPEGRRSLPNLWLSIDSKDGKTSLFSYVKFSPSLIFSTITWHCHVFMKFFSRQTLKYSGVQMLENCNGGSILMCLSELYECLSSEKRTM